MDWFLGILLICALGVYLVRQLMRWVFVKPILEIMDNCESATLNMMVYFLMSGREYWQKQYYQAHEEFELRKSAIAKIRKVGHLRLTKMFMTPKEKEEYKEFMADLKECKRRLEEAQKNYEEFSDQAQ